MNKSLRIGIALVLLVTVWAGISAAQRDRRDFRDRRDRDRWDDDRRDRDFDDRRGVPEWENNEQFKHDVFTFVRVRYNSGGRYGRGWGRRGGGGDWATDYRDSDLNFSFRLQQLTSLRVNPEPVVVELTDPELFDYPFIYIIEPGNLFFTEPEKESLRLYLENGGFLMVDDFWGDYEWLNFYEQITGALGREPVELPLEHPIFHCVYDLKEKPQICSIGHAVRGRAYGVTWEGGPDTRTPHYKGIFDDDGRLMVIICHNTDLGDGWEEEGVDEWYFHEFAENKAYPLGINIVVYAMTH
ncbi:MAG: DUF4159 domain-containing protein [Pirellulales bacterium]